MVSMNLDFIEQIISWVVGGLIEPFLTYILQIVSDFFIRIVTSFFSVLESWGQPLMIFLTIIIAFTVYSLQQRFDYGIR